MMRGLLTQQHRLRRILWIEIALFLCVLFFYIATLFPGFYQQVLFKRYFNPPNIAFYMDEHKQLRGFRLQTLNRPIIKNQALLTWAENAVVTVNTLTSSNYEQQLNTSFTAYFTQNGAKSLLNALKSKGVIDAIVTKKLSITAVVQGAPILLDSGVLFGKYIWKIQIPILLTYESLSEREPYQQLVTLTVAEVNTTQNPLGIAIDQYTSQKR